MKKTVLYESLSVGNAYIDAYVCAYIILANDSMEFVHMYICMQYCAHMHTYMINIIILFVCTYVRMCI